MCSDATSRALAGVAAAVALTFSLVLPLRARAQVSQRLRFDRADQAVAGADGSGVFYAGADNEDGTLAWGTSYVLRAYIVMYRAFGDVRYLDRLCRHADAALAMRDSERGILDYRGRSLPCWRATGYGGQYCWAVHTANLLAPMVELAVLLRDDASLASHATYDGATLADKAAAYLEAGRAGAALYESDWRTSGDRGWYVLTPDATFLATAGDPLPLNMMNAMGILHAALFDATGDLSERDKVERLARHYLGWLATAGEGYAWNYRPSAYVAPGEDVSHGALTMSFAVRAAQSALVVGAAELERFGRTFVDRILVDQLTNADHVGGGAAVNDPAYRMQIGRWLALDPEEPAIHAPVRDAFDGMDATTNGSHLLGMAYLAATDRIRVPFEFYVADWEDLGDTRRATARNANITIRPPAPDTRVLVRLRYSVAARTLVQQWDGESYHTVAKLAPTSAGATATAHVPYDPAHWLDYGGRGALFQLSPGDGIVLAEPEVLVPPAITSTPPSGGVLVAETWSYEPAATGDVPLVWRMSGDVPPSLVIDETTGWITWTPSEEGEHEVVLEVANDYGVAEQTFSLRATRGLDGPDGSAPVVRDAGSTDEPGPRTVMAAGCGCRVTAANRRQSSGRQGALALGLALALLAALARRRSPVTTRYSARRSAM